MCGDGVQDAGEECDDGNVFSDDGCSPTCTEEPCRAAPAIGCRLPAAGKALLKMKTNPFAPAKSQIVWKWTKGDATTVADFGDPTAAEGYHLCIYDAGILVSTTRIEAGGVCAGRPCWGATSSGYRFKDTDLTPDGALQLVLRAGAAGQSRAELKGRGANLELPLFANLTGPVEVQLKQTSDAVCWTAVFGAPFVRRDDTAFLDRSD